MGGPSLLIEKIHLLLPAQVIHFTVKNIFKKFVNLYKPAQKLRDVSNLSWTNSMLRTNGRRLPRLILFHWKDAVLMSTCIISRQASLVGFYEIISFSTINKFHFNTFPYCRFAVVGQWNSRPLALPLDFPLVEVFSIVPQHCNFDWLLKLLVQISFNSASQAM